MWSPTRSGLVVLLIAGLSRVAVVDRDLTAYAGDSAPMLVVLASMVIGGIIGSLLRLESRVEALGGWFQSRLAGDTGSAERHRFIEGFVVSSLVFCTGPLTILGALNDGLGLGADQLFLKATLDGFAAIAFAAVLRLGGRGQRDHGARGPGWPHRRGPDARRGAARRPYRGAQRRGGLLLVGVALRLLRVREIPVADLLPALVVAPLLILSWPPSADNEPGEP